MRSLILVPWLLIQLSFIIELRQTVLLERSLVLLIVVLIGFLCGLRYPALLIERKGVVIDLREVIAQCFQLKNLGHFQSALEDCLAHSLWFRSIIRANLPLRIILIQ